MENHTVVGRFAPTPSGRMHLGNVFSALLCWLSARAQGGRLLLRIEDLDPHRTSPAFTRDMLADLAWLGLNWDDCPASTGFFSSAGSLSASVAFEITPPPKPATPSPDYDGLAPLCHQSRRTSFYAACLETLSSAGLVYPCFCSRAELHAAEAPHLSDGSPLYDGACRALSPQDIASKQQRRPPALRIRVPDTTIAFTDGCQGYYEENLAKDCGDFILRRSDGVFAYQLAAPADDGDMGVTEVVRGRDLLSSTPRQIWLLQTLGYTPPRFCHVPLLLAPDGRRLSKRDADLDLFTLRQNKVSPQRIIGTLAHLAGLVPTPDEATPQDLLPLFSWEQVPKQNITLPENFVQHLYPA